MDLISSPIVTMVLNVLAGALVSHGILDQTSRVMFIQVTDNVIAAIVTVSLGLYSIYKMVDLHKHQITTNATQSTVHMTTPAEQIPAVAAPVVTPVGQTGLPTGQ